MSEPSAEQLLATANRLQASANALRCSGNTMVEINLNLYEAQCLERRARGMRHLALRLQAAESIQQHQLRRG